MRPNHMKSRVYLVQLLVKECKCHVKDIRASSPEKNENKKQTIQPVQMLHW